MKTFILALLKHIKSFNNLFLNLSIKSVTSFNYIKLIIKYYSYFKFILEYFKAYKFYGIIKAFFKFIALTNIILGIFTLIVFTDFRYEEYKLFIENNIINLSVTELFMKFRKAIRTFFKFIYNLLDVEDLDSVKTPKSSNESKSIDKVPSFHKEGDNYKIPKEGIESKSYAPYYCLFAFVTVVICFKYPEYTVTPIVSGITTFVSYLFGGDDDQGGNSNPLDKGKGRAHPIITTDIDHLRTFQPDIDFNPPSSTSSSKSLKDKFFKVFANKTVSSLGFEPNDILENNEWGKTNFPETSTYDLDNYFPETTAHISHTNSGTISPADSSSSNSTVTQASITPNPATQITPTTPTTPSTPGGSKPFSPRWAPPKGGWK